MTAPADRLCAIDARRVDRDRYAASAAKGRTSAADRWADASVDAASLARQVLGAVRGGAVLVCDRAMRISLAAGHNLRPSPGCGRDVR